jgi:tRNA dimethylallyltransferase
MSHRIVITGQTATGKTEVAIEIAKKQNGEIICADSRQVYKYLDIVTGKDKEKFKEATIPVWGLDLIDPNVIFSSHEFAEYATQKINDITSRNKTPIIVGGSYLYIKHLLYGFDVRVGPDATLRDRLEKMSVEELQAHVEVLFKKNNIENPMNQSDWHNPRRLIRKIEILRSESIKETEKNDTNLEAKNVELIGLQHKTKELLIERITSRVEKRIVAGAIDEVKSMLAKGFKPADPGMLTIGCKQIVDFLEGETTEEQMRKEWITKEVQYAKRQYTFMKQNASIEWREV